MHSEYDWISNWSCELLHSKSGYAEYIAVFRTNFFGPEEIWVFTRYEQNSRLLKSFEDISARMDISHSDNSDSTVLGSWVIIASALNENGNQMVESLKSAAQHIEKLLNGQ